MNAVTQFVAHDRRRLQPWPQPRVIRLPPLCIVPQWPRCREPDLPEPPLRVTIAEIVAMELRQ
jgi:hypothetical protein